MKTIIMLTLISLLTACASAPEFNTAQVDKTLIPSSVSAEPELHTGKTVLWGGIILNTENLSEMTQIEVLAYPLNSIYRPLTSAEPLGRFLIRHPGYLEPATYAQGRELTLIGKVEGVSTGNVGESKYSYSIIGSDQLHLWSKDKQRNSTSFHFGVGVGL